MGRDGGRAAIPSHLSVNQIICHCEELFDNLYEMTNVMSDEAIFNIGLLSLFSAIKQHYLFNATSFYFGPISKQSIGEIRHYTRLNNLIKEVSSFLLN